MTNINSEKIYKAVKELCQIVNNNLPKEEYLALKQLYLNEQNTQAKSALKQILQNAQIAAAEKRPLCQDTGFVTIFLNIGQNVLITGENISQTINNAVKDAYIEYFFRKSIVDNVYAERINTKTNTPVLIHTNIVEGNEIEITLSIKGGGCENVSAAKLLKPTQGEEGIINLVLDTIKTAGAKPCPPIRVGIGIGSNFEGACILSKKALLEPLNNNALSLKIKEKINELNIGAMGLGGNSTCFGVNILSEPCHIASLPIAISISCHSSRHGKVKITENEIKYETNDYDFLELEDTNQNIKMLHTSQIEELRSLNKTELILLSGKIYTARDAAHKRFISLLNENKELPIDIKNAIIFYAGPCPANNNEIIGPIGPTTSARMDEFTPILYKHGLLATIGKGERSMEVIDAIKTYNSKYFTVTGGVASLLKKCIKTAKVVAYEDLGAEAVFELEVENLPILHINY